MAAYTIIQVQESKQFTNRANGYIQPKWLGYEIDEAKKSLVTVDCDGSIGSGFAFSLDELDVSEGFSFKSPILTEDSSYIVTNAHVIDNCGQSNPKIISGKRVETISPSASIHDLVNTLNSHHIGALVVSSDGKRIDGIVSERDVVRTLPGKLDQLIGMHVRDIITVEVHTCTSESTVAELMQMMTEYRIRHVPVVDAEGVLISIISIGDIVKNRVAEMESENQALRDYVNTGR